VRRKEVVSGAIYEGGVSSRRYRTSGITLCGFCSPRLFKQKHPPPGRVTVHRRTKSRAATAFIDPKSVRMSASRLFKECAETLRKKSSGSCLREVHRIQHLYERVCVCLCWCVCVCVGVCVCVLGCVCVWESKPAFISATGHNSSYFRF